MRPNPGWARAVVAAGVLGAAGWLVSAQFAPNSRTQAPSRPGFGDGPDVDSIAEAKRVKALNALRHKSVVSDTEKLVKLARQLDAEIASNPTGGLTPEEVQKLAAIEKLAHDVKIKMAQSFGDGPRFRPPLLDPLGPGAQ
ncbi:MAG TPA: hypothetical protein VL135_11290 [Terracidiphilus sp.]|nr:hypothetical protein [Terracidiphilus sp.]